MTVSKLWINPLILVSGIALGEELVRFHGDKMLGPKTWNVAAIQVQSDSTFLLFDYIKL